METHSTKILVVNDDAASLLALNSLLSQWCDEGGYQVLSASCGQDALRHVLKHDFAVILLDVNMPGMDGFETAQAIRSRPRSAQVPIIFVTAFHVDELDKLRAFQLGAADFLFTPLIPQILRAKVQIFVTLAARSLELQRQAEILLNSEASLTAANARLKNEIGNRHKAERQSEAKDEFLAMLGHELRTPLSAITSAAVLLSMSNATPAAAERAKLIVQRQTRHLRAIVDDLLDLTRAMSGEIILDSQMVDVAAIVAVCIDTFRATGRTDAYTLNFQGDECWVAGDPARLEQVVTNLLDNALKYTPAPGRIDIALSLEDGQVVLRIRDSGIGIAEDLLPVLFDVFVQGASSMEHSQGGLGIGLALVKRLAQLHGGEIAAFSAGTNQGSMFQLTLPGASTARIAAPAPATPLPGLATSTSILLVEDNDDGREMMATMLEAYGYRITQAANGDAGLAAAMASPSDLALIDIGLPGIDGYEVARRLRANPATAGMRLIALTGYGLEEDRRRVLAAGFDLHLIKPVDPQQLLLALGSAVAGAPATP